MDDASSQAMAVQDSHVNRDGKVFISHGKGIQIFDPELNAAVGEIKAKFNTHLPKTDVTRERIYTFRIEGDNVWITNIGQIEVLNLKTGKQQKLKGEYSRMPHFRNSGN